MWHKRPTVCVYGCGARLVGWGAAHRARLGRRGTAWVRVRCFAQQGLGVGVVQPRLGGGTWGSRGQSPTGRACAMQHALNLPPLGRLSLIPHNHAPRLPRTGLRPASPRARRTRQTAPPRWGGLGPALPSGRPPARLTHTRGNTQCHSGALGTATDGCLHTSGHTDRRRWFARGEGGCVRR